MYCRILHFLPLFNMVAFDEVTMEWSIVSRIRMNKQDANAHALAFKKTFDACKESYPEFSIGKTLLGVVVDWSDAEIQLRTLLAMIWRRNYFAGAKCIGRDHGKELEIVWLNHPISQDKSLYLLKLLQKLLVVKKFQSASRLSVVK